MQILSMDVGIKNLAGCIITFDPTSKHTATIPWWSLIDLTERQEIWCGETCGKDGRDCGKPATFTAICGQTTSYYCGVHKNLHAVKQESHIREQVSLKSMTATQKTKMMKATSVKPIKTKSCKQLDIVDLKLSLWRQLDAIPNLLQVQHVVIENQPAIKNPTMKSIAETLFAYFLCRGIVDKDKTHSEIVKVHYVSASNKVKLANEFQKELAESTNKYKTTKELAVRTCRQLLEKNPSGERYLSDHKKKDDLCDSLLQGLYFWKKNFSAVPITDVTYAP